ncbi:hypothetical protein HOI18_05445 [Candidatus Uhrbacteria bacterium]|jgi:hypothetical protein|nr:hypothetical protein [Candidatus Uhrbacteria bacterium]
MLKELKSDVAFKMILVIISPSGYYPKDQNASESVVEKVKKLLMKGIE